MNEKDVFSSSVKVVNGFQFTYPKQSDWECELFGMGRGLVITPNVGHVPNRFWRWCQHLIFGNKWKKIIKPKD